MKKAYRKHISCCRPHNISSHHRHALRNRSTYTTLSARPRKHALSGRWRVGPHPIHGTKRAAGSRDEAVALQSESPVACGHWPWPRTRGVAGLAALFSQRQWSAHCSRCATEDVLLTLFDIAVDIPIVCCHSPRCSPVRSP